MLPSAPTTPSRLAASFAIRLMTDPDWQSMALSSRPKRLPASAIEGATTILLPVLAADLKSHLRRNAAPESSLIPASVPRTLLSASTLRYGVCSRPMRSAVYSASSKTRSPVPLVRCAITIVSLSQRHDVAAARPQPDRRGGDRKHGGRGGQPTPKAAPVR